MSAPLLAKRQSIIPGATSARRHAAKIGVRLDLQVSTRQRSQLTAGTPYLKGMISGFWGELTNTARSAGQYHLWWLNVASFAYVRGAKRPAFGGPY